MSSLKQKIDQLYKIFLKDYTKMKEMSLGWFSSKEDEKNREKACQLAEIGFQSCLKISNRMNDIISQVTQQQISKILLAHANNIPYTGTVSKIIVSALTSIAIIFSQIFQVEIIQLLGMSVSPMIPVIGLIIIVGIQIHKTINNKGIILEFFKNKDIIKKLQKIAQSFY